MTPEFLELLQSHWEPVPSIAIGLIAMIVGYLFGTKFRITWKTALFILGIAVLWIGLMSPLDELGDEYLFSAHMTQHMILEFIGPVMLVAALPEEMVLSWMKIGVIKAAERILGNPYFALTVATIVMLVWHVPPIYDLTLENETIHIIEHLTFMASGAMLWWPVFKPIPEGRLKPLPATAYLIVAAFLASILGMIFTMAETPFYAAYANPDDHHNLLPLIREQWGLTHLEDQKLGGAIMWVVCTLNFFWALIAVMIEWLKDEGGEDVGTAKV
ncbi:MAG TPA: cytochrome c oxidase assembly protein [Oculatellaceae cyanobacterium]